MTLIEKFHQWLKREPFSSKERPTLREAQCVQIADDYAIEFLIWASQFELQRFNEDRWQVLGLEAFGFTKTVSTKEILEQFKKEKGL